MGSSLPCSARMCLIWQAACLTRLLFYRRVSSRALLIRSPPFLGSFLLSFFFTAIPYFRQYSSLFSSSAPSLGDGLGRNRQGRAAPLKASLKFDKKGVRFSRLILAGQRVLPFRLSFLSLSLSHSHMQMRHCFSRRWARRAARSIPFRGGNMPSTARPRTFTSTATAMRSVDVINREAKQTLDGVLSSQNR